MKFPFAAVPKSSVRKFFISYAGKVNFDRGFSTLDDVSLWMTERSQAGDILSNEGFVFQWRGAKYPCIVVNRSGDPV